MNAHTNPIITTIAANVSEVDRINARRLQKHAEQCASKRAEIIASKSAEQCASLGNNPKAINDALPPPPEMVHLTATGRAFDQALQRKLSTKQGGN